LQFIIQLDNKFYKSKNKTLFVFLSNIWYATIYDKCFTRIGFHDLIHNKKINNILLISTLAFVDMLSQGGMLLKDLMKI